jgi:hypothetical protein
MQFSISERIFLAHFTLMISLIKNKHRYNIEPLSKFDENSPQRPSFHPYIVHCSIIHPLPPYISPNKEPQPTNSFSHFYRPPTPTPTAAEVAEAAAAAAAA